MYVNERKGNVVEDVERMNIMLANFTKMVDDSGGLAKVTSSFANEMHRRGHQVTLVYSDDRVGKFFYKLDDGIAAYDLRHMDGQSIAFPFLMKAKRELLRPLDICKARTVNNDFAEKYLLANIKKVYEKVKPDVIVASQTASTKLFVLNLGIETPVISMSHGDPEDYFHTYPTNELPALAKCAMCQVLLPSFEQHLLKHVPEAKTIVIGNVVPQYEQKAELAAEKEQYKIITVGRLVRNHKRPHLLIQAFAKIAKEFPDWIVELWGAEDKKTYTAYIKELIKKNSLQDRVFLRGTTDQVPQKLQQADIFAFPSAYEGFGLGMAEAMSMGLPVIGYKNCSAVNELIRDGVNGYLCDDGIDDFAQKLRLLMQNKSERVRMGNKARELIKEYSPEVIWDKWEQLMLKLSDHNTM